jgi:adenylylsulfate kinase
MLKPIACAGKSTIADAVGKEIRQRGMRVQVLDGDMVRTTLCRGLGYSREDRDESVRRIAFVANLLTSHGVIVLVAAISPYRSTRAEIRKAIGNFVEVYVNTPLCICEARDTKGLYRRARSGELRNFTGIDAPYEVPLVPDLRLDTSTVSLGECVSNVLVMVQNRIDFETNER